MKNRNWLISTFGVLAAGLLCMLSVRGYQTQYMMPVKGERYVSDEERMMRLSEQLPKLHRQIQLMQTRYDAMKQEVESLGGHVTQKGSSVMIRWKVAGAKK